MKDIFHQTSFEEINSENSKLRTYAKLKTEIGREQYLDSIKNIKDRTALTKIRLSNHELMIEKGRHLDLQEHQRLCPFCDNKIENEQHFVIECPTYNVLRQKLFHDIAENNNEFNELNEFEKFCFLLTAKDAGDLISEYLEYLNKTLQIRKYLMEKPKQNG